MKALIITLLFLNHCFALTEEDIKASVLENFPLIEEALMKEEAATGELTAAKGSFDHKLTFKSRKHIEDKYNNSYIETSIERRTPWKGVGLMAGHRQGRGLFAPYEGKYATSSAGEIFAGFSVPLLRNFNTDEARTNVEIARLEKKQAQVQVFLKKNMYLHKALSLYYQWILEERKLTIRKGLLQLAEERNTMIEQRFKAGDVERLKITDNQRSLDKRRDEIIKNEIELAKIKASLSLFLRGERLAVLNRPEAEMAQHSGPEAATLIKPFNPTAIPQFSILELERKKLVLLEDLYRQQRLPGLALEVLGSKELSANEAYDPERLHVGVKFDFPLENRKAEGKTVASLYKKKSLERQMDYIRQEISRYYDFSLKAMNDSLKRWEIVKREFVNTKKMADAERRRWIQGSSDLFIVNLREQDLADAEIRKWTALYDFRQYSLDARLYSASFDLQ